MEIYFDKYVEQVSQLAGCGERLAQRSIDNFKETISRGLADPGEQEAFTQLLGHFRHYAE